MVYETEFPDLIFPDPDLLSIPGLRDRGYVFLDYRWQSLDGHLYPPQIKASGSPQQRAGHLLGAFAGPSLNILVSQPAKRRHLGARSCKLWWRTRAAYASDPSWRIERESWGMSLLEPGDVCLPFSLAFFSCIEYQAAD